MYFVTEYRSPGKSNISYLMALDAITLYRKGRFAFVTTSTGLALLHLQHRKMWISPVCLEQSVMTIGTAVNAEMNFVTEHQ